MDVCLLVAIGTEAVERLMNLINSLLYIFEKGKRVNDGKWQPKDENRVKK